MRQFSIQSIINKFHENRDKLQVLSLQYFTKYLRLKILLIIINLELQIKVTKRYSHAN